MKSVGERIRQARNARKMSGEALAKLVGYKQQSAIGNLENRPGGTGGNKISEIADALQVPLEWLLRGPDSEQVPTVPQKTPWSGPQRTDFQLREPDSLLSDQYMTQEASATFARLSSGSKSQALVYLKFLQSQEAQPSQSVSGEDNSLSHKKAA